MRRVSLTLLLALTVAAGLVAPGAGPRPAAAQAGGVCAEYDNIGICVRWEDGGGGDRTPGGFAPIGAPVCGSRSGLGPCVEQVHPQDPACFRWVNGNDPTRVGQWRERAEPRRLCGTANPGGGVEIEDRIVPVHRTVHLAPRGSETSPGITGLATELAIPLGATIAGSADEHIERAFVDGTFGAHLAGGGRCGTYENGDPITVGNGGFEWLVARVELDAGGRIQDDRTERLPTGAVGLGRVEPAYEPVAGPAMVWELAIEAPGTYVLGLVTCWQGFAERGGVEWVPDDVDWRFAIGQFVLVTADDGSQGPIYHVREIRSQNN